MRAAGHDGGFPRRIRTQGPDEGQMELVGSVADDHDFLMECYEHAVRLCAQHREYSQKM